MRVRLLVNPRSGKGLGPRLAAEFGRCAVRDGHEVTSATLPARTPAPEPHDPGPDVVAVFGGDGTVHHSLPALAGSPTALYHVPLGTENLFARGFGMDRDPERFAAALRSGSVLATDLGECNGRLFAIMASVGPDAGLIHRMAGARRGTISHWSYLRPALAELARPRFCPLSVLIDGSEAACAQSGFAIVANSRCYALGLDPVRRALVTDGLLDVVFYPCRGRARALGWIARTAQGRHMQAPALIYRQGREVVLSSEGQDHPPVYQLDGEAVTGAARTLTMRVIPGALRVLVPAPGAGAAR
ncbi:MAG TPA: diacylglycerol kinase family protein [Phycisphaerales bacterium]|nr:diacylglycerol kinase family protein [Phycisphaerales bacterium]